MSLGALAWLSQGQGSLWECTKLRDCFQAALSTPHSKGRSHRPQPQMTSCSTWYPCLSKASLTSSQIPGDEAEEEADDVSQVLLTAMLTLLQSRVAALTTPRHGAAQVLVLCRPFQTLGSAPFFRQDLPSPHRLLACFSFKSLSWSLLVLTYLLACFLAPALGKSPKTNSP